MPSFSLPPDVMALVRSLTQRVTDLERKITARASAPASKALGGGITPNLVAWRSIDTVANGGGVVSPVTSWTAWESVGAPAVTYASGDFTFTAAGFYLLELTGGATWTAWTGPDEIDVIAGYVSGPLPVPGLTTLGIKLQSYGTQPGAGVGQDSRSSLAVVSAGAGLTLQFGKQNMGTDTGNCTAYFYVTRIA